MIKQSQILACLSEIQHLSLEAKRLGGDRRRPTQGYVLSQQMLDQIANLAEVDRYEIMQNLSREESSFLHGIARGRAIKAVRESNHEDLRYGLVALIFENLREDWRETLVKLCLLNHSAEKLGVNLETIFQGLRHLAKPEMVRLIDDYFKEGERNIGAMGYKEDTSTDGFTYTRI
jgi:hypothetical protein